VKVWPGNGDNLDYGECNFHPISQGGARGQKVKSIITKVDAQPSALKYFDVG
jgi:hypothetical protein